MALKIKLVKSKSGSSEDQLRTLQGLGLWRMGQERLLKDTPAIRGMVFKLQHLVSLEQVSGDPKSAPRRKPRKIVLKERSRSAQSASGQTRRAGKS